jgi:predicted nucleotidyltransferase
MDPKVLESEAVARICRAHGVRRLSLFGSRLKGTARADSDVDLLVEFAPGRTPGLIGMSTIEIELGCALGHKVDLRTALDLSPHFRDEVVRNAKLAYAA